MMLRRIHGGATSLAALLGLLHIALTPVFQPAFGEAAIWFAGSGLAVVLAGLLNLQFLLRRGLRAIVVLSNVATSLFFALLLAVVQEPQVVFGLVLFVVLTFGSCRLRDAAP